MMVLRARWTGDHPAPGQYLASSGRRTKYAYKILAVEVLKSHPAVPGFTRMKLCVDRIFFDDIPDGALVHPWQWDPRKAGFNKERV